VLNISGLLLKNRGDKLTFKHTITKNNLEDLRMKKVMSILALALVMVGLTGCLDSQDGSKQKVSSSVQL
jgi:hypothetical protein